MKTLSLDPKIIAMARGLGLPADNAVQNILSFCRSRVAKLLRPATSIHTIWDFEKVVCDHLNLVVHEIWNDDELRAFSRRYAKDEGDLKFAALDMELEKLDTYGVIYQRNVRNEAGEMQYVAFVDCRGAKALRRFFTRWHEIAHCLTTYQQFELPFRRTNTTDIEKDAVEKLMDKIAGELGFSEPLFQPILTKIQNQRVLDFDIVEEIRQQFCPDASFQSTLNACVSQNTKPLISLEVRLGLNKSQKEFLQDSQIQLLPSRAPTPVLRVLRSVPNEKARKVGLQIHKQWRVPDFSIITKVFNSEAEISGESFENLGDWKSSDGSSLPDIDVLIHARKIQNRVLAIVSLA